MAQADPPIATVAVAPTLTTIFSMDVRALGLVTVQIQNMDATQTFSGYVRRSAVVAGLTSAPSSMPDFLGIAPAGSLDANGNPTDVVVADIDVEGSGLLSIVGFMSGAGGNVQYTARKAGPKR